MNFLFVPPESTCDVPRIEQLDKTTGLCFGHFDAHLIPSTASAGDSKHPIARQDYCEPYRLGQFSLIILTSHSFMLLLLPKFLKQQQTERKRMHLIKFTSILGIMR